MTNVWTLTKRHIKTYLRDKASVFFSFLSIIILLAIYLLFMGNMLEKMPMLTDAENSKFVLGYVMGGVLVVASLTLPLGVIGSFVTDLEQKRLNAFLVMPIKRKNLTLSYFLSTFIVSFVLILIMFAITVIYIGATTALWMAPLQIVTGVAFIALFLFLSVPIVLFLITFIKTSGAFGGLSSILGTLIGFISGIYIPLSKLGGVTTAIAGLLPFSHMTVFMRRFLIGPDIVSKMPTEALNDASINYLNFFGANINISYIFLGFALLSVGFLVLSYYRMNKKKSS